MYQKYVWLSKFLNGCWRLGDHIVKYHETHAIISPSSVYIHYCQQQDIGLNEPMVQPSVLIFMYFTHKIFQDDRIKAGTNTMQRRGIYKGRDNTLHYFKQDKVLQKK